MGGAWTATRRWQWRWLDRLNLSGARHDGPEWATARRLRPRGGRAARRQAAATRQKRGSPPCVTGSGRRRGQARRPTPRHTPDEPPCRAVTDACGRASWRQLLLRGTVVTGPRPFAGIRPERRRHGDRHAMQQWPPPSRHPKSTGGIGREAWSAQSVAPAHRTTKLAGAIQLYCTGRLPSDL